MALLSELGKWWDVCRFSGTLAAVAMIALCSAAFADLIWWDGTPDPGGAPPGKLLSDNRGYYGDCVRTGVDYALETEPDIQPSKARKSKKISPGRQLLDGQAGWEGSGVAANGPIAAVFDFKRNCAFGEVDVSSVRGKYGIKIEVADAEPGDWRVVFERSLQDSPEASLHRIKLPDKPKGCYVRLSVAGGEKTRVDEVHVWGDAEVTKDDPEAFDPVIQTLPVIDWCQFSIPGIDKMGVVFNEFRDWKNRLGDAAKLPAIWSRVPTWDGITERPILPEKDRINKPVSLTMARNETECAAVALTNISWPDPIAAEVKIGGFRRVSDGKPAPKVIGKLRVAGAIPSCIFGVVLGPLFEEDNMPGLSVLKHYITNADGIHDFPKLDLPAMTSVVMWLSVATDGAEPGVYEAGLSCSTPGAQPMKVRAEVLDVTLPDTFAWIVCYSYETRMFPFQYSDRLEREVAYRKSIGLNVYHGFPNPGSLADVARKAGPVSFLTYGISEDLTRPLRENKPTPASDQALADRIKALVKEGESVGLTYDDWALELWDEPNKEGCEGYGRICEFIHSVDPKLRMYCNPTTNDIGDWYTKHVAVSVPFFKAIDDTSESRRLFSAKRPFNAFYIVATNSAKGERADLLERYRRFAWEAIVRGWNGWGFYAFFRPEGDPWNDFDLKNSEGQSSPDFEMVYPGPRGPIPTRQSEAVREGWEDYRLMTLLRERGMKSEVDSISKDFKNGVPLTELRLRALKAAAKKR